jgi:D-alanine-D-alanine ligase
MEEPGGCRPLRVAVVMGGQSAEREVSVRTGRTVAGELSRRHAVKPVEILSSGLWRVPEGYLGAGLDARPEAWAEAKARPILEAASAILEDGVEVVFNALHGPLGEDGTAQGFFRMLGLPFTGPDVIPAAVTMDKRLTKLGLAAAGLSTPRFFTVRSGTLWAGPVDWRAIAGREAARVPFPWILKPNRLGSTVGVAVFADAEDLARGAGDLIAGWPASSRQDDLLVEEVVRGRELTCGVLETDGTARALPPIEIRPRAGTLFDYHAKYTPGASEELCPAPLAPAERRLVEETALAVHCLFECAPLSRTDMFLLDDGTVQVLEVNTLPGMTSTSLIPLSAHEDGLRLGDLFEAILRHALRRSESWGEKTRRTS